MGKFILLQKRVLMSIEVTIPGDLTVTVKDEANQSVNAGVPNNLPAHDLNSHSDVNVDSPEDLQLLQYDAASGKWIPVDTIKVKKVTIDNTSTNELLQIGDSELVSVGSETAPAIKLGKFTGIFIDANRIFFTAAQFLGGFSSQGLIGYSCVVSTLKSGTTSVNVPFFSAYRADNGLKAGLGGNMAGDASLIANDKALFVARLDGTADTSQANTLRLPAHTNTTRDALTSMQVNDLINNTDTGKIQRYNGTIWVDLF